MTGCFQDEEFRSRHEAMLQQQRYEAAMVRRKLQDEKNRLKSIQKEAVQGFVSQRVRRNRDMEVVFSLQAVCSVGYSKVVF